MSPKKSLPVMCSHDPGVLGPIPFCYALSADEAPSRPVFLWGGQRSYPPSFASRRELEAAFRNFAPRGRWYDASLALLGGTTRAPRARREHVGFVAPPAPGASRAWNYRTVPCSENHKAFYWSRVPENFHEAVSCLSRIYISNSPISVRGGGLFFLHFQEVERVLRTCWHWGQELCCFSAVALASSCVPHPVSVGYRLFAVPIPVSAQPSSRDLPAPFSFDWRPIATI